LSWSSLKFGTGTSLSSILRRWLECAIPVECRSEPCSPLVRRVSRWKYREETIRPYSALVWSISAWISDGVSHALERRGSGSTSC